MSPLSSNIKSNYLNNQRISNALSTENRSTKYHNCEVLNNLNNYKPNVIMGNKTTKNKDIVNKNIIHEKNSSSSKANGASHNNIDNYINIISSPATCLNTIGISLFNTNNISNENSIQTNYIKYNNGTNLNDISSFSRNQLNKKIKDINNKIGNIKKEINSIKSQYNYYNTQRVSKLNSDSKKRSNLIYNSNKANNKDKKDVKSSMNSINNNINGNNDLNENQYLEQDKKDNITKNEKNKFNNEINYKTVDGDDNGGDMREELLHLGDINNNLITKNNNKRNKDENGEVIGSLNSLISMKSFNNINNDNNIEERNNENNGENIDDIGYQTYTTPFRNFIIKVNMIEKDNPKKKNENTKSVIIENDTKNMKLLNKNNNETKSSPNLKTGDNNMKINDKKNLMIKTNLKCDEIIELNKLNEKKNDFATDFNYENNIIYFSNELKSCKNENLNRVINSINFNIYPLSRDSSKTYIKKKSSNESVSNYINNEKINMINNTSRSSINKPKKNYSISSSYDKTQKNNKDINLMKYKNNKKYNYLYSPKRNQIGKSLNSKSVFIKEDKVKLDNIKSRVTELLNVYSLLALRALNDIAENNENKEKKV